MDTPRRQSAAASASGSSLSNEHRLSVHSNSWDEPTWPDFLFTVREPEYSINLEPPPTTTKSRLPWRKQSSPQRYLSVGFAPNCKLAFVLEKHGVHIYSLKGPPDLSTEHRAELNHDLLQPSNGVVVDAVLSNRYLATVDRYKLDTFQLDPNGYLLNRHFSTDLESPANASKWVPTCLTIFDNGGSCTWVAVGFRVKKDDGHGGDIKVYLVEASGITEEIGRYDKAVRSTFAGPLQSESVRKVAFSPDGDRLACITSNNVVLVWSWSHRGKSWQPPFAIERAFSPDGCGKGMTSVSLFKSPSNNPYILCTTYPSSERGLTGEWPLISPVFNSSGPVRHDIQHSIKLLRDPILVGAVTSVGELIAVLEASGKVRLLALDRGRDGGLHCPTYQNAALKFDKQLSKQESTHPTSLRFQETLEGLHIFAIDLYGKLIVKTVMRGTYPPIRPVPTGLQELSAVAQAQELGTQTVIRTEINQIIHQLEDSQAPNGNAPPQDPQLTRTSTRRTQDG